MTNEHATWKRVDYGINQSVNQSINHQSINPSINPSISQSDSQSFIGLQRQDGQLARQGGRLHRPRLRPPGAATVAPVSTPLQRPAQAGRREPGTFHHSQPRTRQTSLAVGRVKACSRHIN